VSYAKHHGEIADDGSDIALPHHSDGSQKLLIEGANAKVKLAGQDLVS